MRQPGVHRCPSCYPHGMRGFAKGIITCNRRMLATPTLNSPFRLIHDPDKCLDASCQICQTCGAEASKDIASLYLRDYSIPMNIRLFVKGPLNRGHREMSPFKILQILCNSIEILYSPLQDFPFRGYWENRI